MRAKFTVSSITPTANVSTQESHSTLSSRSVSKFKEADTSAVKTAKVRKAQPIQTLISSKSEATDNLSRKKRGTTQPTEFSCKKAKTTKSKSAWKPMEVPSLSTFESTDNASSVYNLEELEGVDVVVETGVSGAKIIRFKNTVDEKEVELFGIEDDECEDLNEELLSGFIHIDDFKEVDDNGDEVIGGDNGYGEQSTNNCSLENTQDSQTVPQVQEENIVTVETTKPAKTKKSAEDILSAKKLKRKQKKKDAIKAASELKALLKETAEANEDNEESESFNAEHIIVEDFDTTAWEKYDLDESIIKALKFMKFRAPTEIQDRVLPIALKSKRNIIGVAETGSGKTLAFGLPILQSLMKQEYNPNSAYSLILAPTRELAMQINDHIKKLAKFTKFHIISIVGGLSHDKQNRLLSKKPDIIIATPGRLWEFISSNEIYMNYIKNVEYLVIDEADRMLESGHFRELESILNVVRPQNVDVGKKCYLFSATLINDGKIKMKLAPKKGAMKQGPGLDELVGRLNLTSADTVHINVLGKNTMLSSTLSEYKIECIVKDKDMYLYYLLTQNPSKTLIFVNSIDSIRRLVPLLQLLGIKCYPLHAELQQKQRLKNLDRFSAEKNAVLVASDVAARGLDVDVELVVHYQVPKSVDVYIHRSGRTARAGNDGMSIIMIAPEEVKLFKKICMVLKRVGLPDFTIDRLMLSEISKRIILARKINNAEHKKQKTKYEKSWMKKTAEEADIYLSDDEDDEVNATEEDTKMRNLKAQLSQMIAQEMLPTRLKNNFYSGARGTMDEILKIE